MLAVCRAYYLEDKSKVSIGEEFGISRFRVAALLAAARETGLVTVTVNSGMVYPEMSGTLAAHLGLQRAIVVEAYGSREEVLDAVGKAAGDQLLDGLSTSDVVGMASGRTISAMVKQLRQLPQVDIVQLTGTVGSDLTDSPIDLVRQVSHLAGQSALAPFAPLFLDDERTATDLRKQKEIARVLEAYNRVTTAVVAVGSFSPPNSRVLDVLSPDQRDVLLSHGAVAEVCGIPCTRDGDIVDHGYLGHLIGITPIQLRAVRRVIAAASGTEKALAVYAVCRTGMIDEVVVDIELAQQLLSMPSAA
jgi:DNA-binding transcriptional regulator LsrR (DeoR family)